MRPLLRFRSGFTLVELLIASCVGIIVLTAVVSVFITTQRMLKSAMAESELALAMRELRDRLLFSVAPPVNGRTSAGLLSAVAFTDHGVPVRSTFENQIRQGYVELWAPTLPQANPLAEIGENASRASLRLRGFTVGRDNILINEHVPDRDRTLGWLWPARIPLAEAWGAGQLDYAAINPNDANNPMIYRFYLDLALKANVKRADGSDIIRRERVSVPLCGRIQKYSDRNSDGKDTY